MKRLTIILVALLFTALAWADEAAGSIFGPINAETNDLTQFTSTVVPSANTLATAAAAKNNGTYGFRATFDGTAVTQAYGVKTFSEQAEIYVRGYFYIPATNVVNNYSLVYLISLVDGAEFAGGVGYREVFDESMEWGGSARYDDTYTATNATKGAWHRVEIRWVSHETTGGIQVWIDGTLILTDLDQDNSALKVDGVYIGPFDRSAGDLGLDNGNYIDFDDILGSDAAIGAYTDSGGGGGGGIPQLIHYYNQQ